MDGLPPRTAWRVRRATPRPEPPSDNLLVEDGIDAIPVRVFIVQEGLVTGWDDGALGIEEDAMWFSGTAMSFHVAAVDMIAAPTKPWDPADLTRTGKALRAGLSLCHPTRDVRLYIHVHAMRERREWEDEDRIAQAIVRLIARRDSSFRSQYPPLRLRPNAVATEYEDWKAHESMKTKRLPFWLWLLSSLFVRRRPFWPPAEASALLRKIAAEEADLLPSP